MLNGYKIFIDPGHGGTDNGASNVAEGLYEDAIALDVANRLNTRLKALGATTQMSRTTDTNPSLQSRVTASNNFGANIYISTHVNAGGGTGIETWVHDKSSANTVKLAEYIGQSMATRLSATLRHPTTKGVRKAPSQRDNVNIYVVDPSVNKAWAVLPEFLFIDNATDIPKLKSSTYRQYAAEGIATGINNFVATLPPIN